MSCDRIESDGMRYLDNEMTGPEKEGFEKHLDECGSCRRSVMEMKRLDDLAGALRIKDPMDMFWEGYWKSIYRRIERKTAIILILAGAVMILLNEIYRAVRNFGRLTFGKVAVIVIIAGLAMLLLSVARERYHQRKTDRYKDIIR